MLYFLKIFNSKLSCIEVWLTDRNSKAIDNEYKINITFVVKKIW